MDIYNWSRAQTDEEKQIYREDDSPPAPVATTATLDWNGVATPLWIEPLAILGTYYFAFRPVGAPESEAFVVGTLEWGGRVDEFGWQDVEALAPYARYGFSKGDWMADVSKNIESGCYGQMNAERHTQEDMEGWLWSFFGARGRVAWDSNTRRTFIGNLKKPGFYQLCHPNFSPTLNATPWCEAQRAPELLRQLNSEQLDERLERESQNPATPAGFAHAWENWSHAERRAQLPALERDVENELCRVLKWAFWSAPELRELAEFPLNTERLPQWFRPRFVVQSDDAGGHFFFNELRLGQSNIAVVQGAQRRIEKLWPHLARAFEAQRELLRAERDALHPNLAHWCHRRGCYAVKFEAPTAHEKLESSVALRDWLKRRAGVELEEVVAG